MHQHFHVRSSANCDFLESPHAHECLLDKEGTGAATRRNEDRSWAARLHHQLFLLDAADCAARLHCAGPYSVEYERTKHYTQFRGTVHPWCRFRKWWMCLVQYCVISTIFTFTMTTSELYAGDAAAQYLVYFNYFCEAVMIMDIFMNFRCGYVDRRKRQVVLDRSAITIHYLHTKIFLHILTAIPLQMFVSLAQIYTQRPILMTIRTNFVTLIRMLNLFRLLRVVELTRCWSLSRRRLPYSSTQLCDIVKTYGLFVLVINTTTNFGFALTQLEATVNGHLDSNSTLYLYKYIKYHSQLKINNISFFTLEKSRMVKTFAISSHGTYKLKTPADLFINMANYMIGAVFYLWCILAFAMRNYVNNYALNKKEDMVNQTKSYVLKHRVSPRLTQRVVEYCEYCQLVNARAIRSNEMYTSLPKSFINEIKIFLLKPFLKNVELFANWPEKVLDDLTLLLKQEVYITGDTYCCMATPNDTLSVVQYGVLAKYLMGGTEVGRYSDGDFFGENCLVAAEDLHTADVVAVTNCCMVGLTRKAFVHYMGAHPKLMEALFDVLDSSVTSRPGSSNLQTPSFTAVYPSDRG